MNLAEPPVVVSQGRATHGVGRLVDEFQLPDLWSLHLYAYSAELEVDGLGYAITPGSVSLVPPASVIRYRYEGPSTHLYAHLRTRPEMVGDEVTWPLHLLMSPGPELAVITDLMESAVDSAATRPERTRADIWLALLRLSALARDRGRDSPRRNPAQEHLTRALAHIERHLSEPLTVPEIAAAVGVSHNHLTRLFTAGHGLTVVGYLRRRRIEHARQLLVHSTMSIAAIASTVGIPDLQAFNKACRTVTGLGPRALREAGGSAVGGGAARVDGSR
ncbi:MAG TPA: AraC family transcriptional regulator [Microlunatus sp.]